MEIWIEGRLIQGNQMHHFYKSNIKSLDGNILLVNHHAHTFLDEIALNLKGRNALCKYCWGP